MKRITPYSLDLCISIIGIIFLSILSNCTSINSTRSHSVSPSQNHSQEKSHSESSNKKPLSPNGKSLLLESTQIEYFEVPGLSTITDPESLRTFSIRVKNQTHIEKFRRLATKESNIYRTNPPGDCQPSYNSALVFQKTSHKETVLFSLDCGLLYFYQEKLYLDVGLERMEIENTFRQIRSGR